MVKTGFGRFFGLIGVLRWFSGLFGLLRAKSEFIFVFNRVFRPFAGFNLAYAGDYAGILGSGRLGVVLAFWVGGLKTFSGNFFNPPVVSIDHRWIFGGGVFLPRAAVDLGRNFFPEIYK